MRTKTNVWRIDFDGLKTVIKPVRADYAQWALNGMMIDLSYVDAGICRRNTSWAQIWAIEIDRSGAISWFVSRVKRDSDYFFSFLAEYYPQDLNFILFHPELFRGEFNP